MPKYAQIDHANRITESLVKKELIAFLKILHWFFDYPDGSLGLNDLAKNVRVSKTTTRKIVESLVKEGFLQKTVLGKVWNISCKKEHSYNHTLKVCYHLEWIYEKDILYKILKRYPVARAIILFGSYRKGDDTEKSDIDIAVEVLGHERMKIVPFLNLKGLGYRKNVQVNLHVFSRSNIDVNLFTNIANGIGLYGLLEVKP